MKLLHKNFLYLVKSSCFAMMIFMACVPVAVANPLPADPCPSPKETMRQDISDLELVQEDITRLTICVERAQLLDRLNTLVDENSDTIQSSIQDEIDAIGNSIDFQSMATPPAMGKSQSEAVTTMETLQPQWRVRDISGSKGALKATVINNQNIIKIVQSGDKLDDTLIVQSITHSHVTVGTGIKKQSLEWSE